MNGMLSDISCIELQYSIESFKGLITLDDGYLGTVPQECDDHQYI